MIAVILLLLQLKSVLCSDIDNMMAEASEPNVIQIDAFGKVSTNSEPELDDRKLMLEEMRLRREMAMRRRRKDGPTIIMMPSPPAYPAPEQPYAAQQQPAPDADRYASYDTRLYPQNKSCYVTTNICDRSQDDVIKKTVQRTVQKSIESSVKNSLKQALVPLIEELTRRMGEDLPQPTIQKYQEDMQAYTSKFVDKL